jgi:hypothetical protein
MAPTHHKVVPSLTYYLQYPKILEIKFTKVYSLWIYIHILSSVYGRYAIDNLHISFSMFSSQALL